MESYQHGGLVLHSKIITAQEGRRGSEAGSTDKEGFGKKGCALVGLPSISTLDALSRRMKTELFDQVSHKCIGVRPKMSKSLSSKNIARKASGRGAGKMTTEGEDNHVIRCVWRRMSVSTGSI